MQAAFHPFFIIRYEMAIRLFPPSDRRVARQLFWLGAMLGVQFLATILQLSLSARILGPEGYGVLAIIIAATSLVYGFMSMPGSQAIVTFVARSVAGEAVEEAARILRFTFVTALTLALISYVLLVVLATTASSWMGLASHHASALLVYGVTGLFSATLQESLSVLRLADRLALAFVVTALGSLTRVVLLLAAWSFQGGLKAIIFSYVAAAIVNGVGMLIAATGSVRHAGIPGLFKSCSLRVPSDVVKFQLVSFCQTKVGALAGNLDLIMLGTMVNPAQVGLYRAARQIIDSVRLPARPISEAIQVEYSRRWYAYDGTSVRSACRRFTTISVALAAVTYLGLIGIHEYVIAWILGPEFVDAASVLLIMVPGGFAFMSASALYLLPAATGRALPSLVSTLLALCAMAISMLVLVPTSGVAGAAWSRTIYFLVLVLVTTFFAVHVIRQSHLRAADSARDDIRLPGRSTTGENICNAQPDSER